jgi:hypothetical protein
MAENKDRSVALEAVRTIRSYWKARVDTNTHEQVQVEINPETYVIKSNLINGLPRRRTARLEM